MNVVEERVGVGGQLARGKYGNPLSRLLSGLHAPQTMSASPLMLLRTWGAWFRGS